MDNIKKRESSPTLKKGKSKKKTQKSASASALPTSSSDASIRSFKLRKQVSAPVQSTEPFVYKTPLSPIPSVSASNVESPPQLKSALKHHDGNASVPKLSPSLPQIIEPNEEGQSRPALSTPATTPTPSPAPSKRSHAHSRPPSPRTEVLYRYMVQTTTIHHEVNSSRPDTPSPNPVYVGLPMGNTVEYRGSPVNIVCQFCGQPVTTVISYNLGLVQLLSCCLLSMFTGLICPCICCVPFCLPECGSIIHICPNCNRTVGTYSAW